MTAEETAFWERVYIAALQIMIPMMFEHHTKSAVIDKLAAGLATAAVAARRAA